MASYTWAGFTPRVHPLAYVHPSAQLLGDVELCEEASTWPTTVVRGDSGRILVGARSNLQDGTICHASTGVTTTTLGVDVTVGHRVILHGCAVGNSCLIGMGAIILDNVEIGEWSFVAAGALLTPGKKFPPRSFILGSPARRLREVGEREITAILHGTQSYLELTRTYRKGG